MINYYWSRKTSVVITTKKPFENKDEEEDVYWNINRVLTVGGRRFLSKKEKIENLNGKVSILFSLALRGILILKNGGLILPPNCVNNIEDVTEINKILLACRYTRGYYEYDIKNKELIKIPCAEA